MTASSKRLCDRHRRLPKRSGRTGQGMRLDLQPGLLLARPGDEQRAKLKRYRAEGDALSFLPVRKQTNKHHRPIKMRQRMRESVDAAIAAGEEPRAPKRGPGLVLNVPGGRPKRLIETRGHLTPGVAYLYERTAREPPSAGIDPTAALRDKGSAC